jgi:hypothetical protein
VHEVDERGGELGPSGERLLRVGEQEAVPRAQLAQKRVVLRDAVPPERLDDGRTGGQCHQHDDPAIRSRRAPDRGDVAREGKRGIGGERSRSHEWIVRSAAVRRETHDVGHAAAPHAQPDVEVAREHEPALARVIREASSETSRMAADAGIRDREERRRP